VKRKRKNL
jgi:hypothetical protein